MNPTQHLETQQALVKQLAEILEFVLKFDEFKVSQRLIDSLSARSPLKSVLFPAVPDENARDSERLQLLPPHRESAASRKHQ